MQATVKLYDLGYAESKIWLAATLFIVGNITLPPTFPSHSARRSNMAAHLFFSPLSVLTNMDGNWDY